jgi:NADPH-dependent 2,4-dienoyl-CoA reductase/sulfur reductase-like enzyme
VQTRAVVVGASLAGLRAAEALRREGHDGQLTIIGSETHQPYDRPPLSKQVLTGRAGADDIALMMQGGVAAEWRLGVTATGLDAEGRRVLLDDGDAVPFDHLVIATGAHPRRMVWAPRGPGVHYLRTIEDALRLRDELEQVERAVVIGAGFIGLEVAASAHERGVNVTVLEALPFPLERAIGPEMGGVVADIHRRRDIDLRFGVGVEGLVGDGGVEGVQLADASIVDAQLVVVGIGVAPTTGWLEGAGFDLENGVLCDDRLRVLQDGRPRPDIVAVGDVARWYHAAYGEPVRIEHWTNAADQGEAAARALLQGDAAPPYAPTPYFWSDQHGLKIQFVGETRPGDTVTLLEGDPDQERFVVAYGRHGRLVAALGVRRPARVMALQRMISDGADVPDPE